jgi:hypothetical protein
MIEELGSGQQTEERHGARAVGLGIYTSVHYINTYIYKVIMETNKGSSTEDNQDRTFLHKPYGVWEYTL